MALHDYFPGLKIIRYVSAPCSTGKTTAACRYIAERYCLHNYLYVAPTRQLVDQTFEVLRGRGLDPIKITGDTDPKRVKAEIIPILGEVEDVGLRILLVTWSAFITLRFFPNRDIWLPVVDEVPQVDEFYPLMLPRNQRFLTEYLTVAATDHAKLGMVMPKDRKHLKRLLDDARDQVDDVFRDLFSDVLSPHKLVYVDMPSWDRIVARQEVVKQHEMNTVFFLAMLKPDPLLGSILLGANVEDSLLYHWFKLQRVTFKREEGIAKNLRPLPDDLGDRLRLSYFVKGRNFSKYLAAQEAKDGGVIIDRMDALALKTFGNADFLYVANKDRKSPVLDAAPNAKRISVACHGLNSLQHYNRVYFSAALNRSPQHFTMLNRLGLSPEIVHRATAHEAAYQVIMRTSLRNPDSSEKVHAIVPDQATAERVAQLLGCKNIDQIGNLVSPPPQRLSQTDKSRRLEFARLKRGLFGPRDIPDPPLKGRGMDPGSEAEATEVPSQQPGNSTCMLTFHKHPKQSDAREFIRHECDLHEFIGMLRIAARTPLMKKDELFLWNPAIYDPSRGNGYRTQANFIRSYFLVLDFDGGTLSPEQFVDIYWNKAPRGLKHSLVICNSFSRCPEMPNKYRAIFPYLRPALSIAEHKAAYAYVVRRLRGAGHTEASSKLDAACKSGVQSFWMPCTNREFPKWAFFGTYGTKMAQLAKCAIDPQLCLGVEEAAQGELHPAPAPVGHVREELLAEAEALATQIRQMACNRHRPFFNYGVLLARAGLGRWGIEGKLRELAGREQKMLKKIPGILRSLHNYGWFGRK